MTAGLGSVEQELVFVLIRRGAGEIRRIHQYENAPTVMVAVAE